MSTKPPYPHENYYRVSVKALIFDDRGRLLLFRHDNGEWAVPGGGLDHAEDFEAGLKRELAEEMALEVQHVGPLAFVYRHETKHGHPKISLAFPVQLKPNPRFVPSDDDDEDIVEARFVGKEEFTQLPFQHSETPVKKLASQIWQLAPPVEKAGQNG